MTLVARYLFDEAASGTTPTEVIDDTPSPVDLNITYTGTAAWTVNGSGRGLNIDGNSGSFAQLNIGGTKYETALEGSTTGTVILALDFGPTDSFAFGIEHPGVQDHWWNFFPGDGTVGSFLVATSGTADISGISPGYHVLALVLDTDQATDTDRFRVYVDGVQVTTLTGPVAANTISVTSNSVLTLGAGASGADPFPGGVYAAAYYSNALDAEYIAAISTLWAADNDEALSFPAARYVKLVALDEINSNGPYSSGAEVDILDESGTPIVKTGWVSDADSYDAGFESSKIHDGDIDTLWHTQFGGGGNHPEYPSNPRHPHWVVFDLGSTQMLSRMVYYPRESGGTNGSLKHYQIYLSADGESWAAQPNTEGDFSSDANISPLFEPSTFDGAAARYVGGYEAFESNEDETPAPEELEAGDYGVFFVFSPTGGAVTLGDDAVGMDLLHREDHTTDDLFIAVYGKFLSGTETIFSASTGDPLDSLTTSLLLVRNAHLTSPVADVSGNQGTGDTVVGTSVTAAVDHSLLFFALFTFDLAVITQPAGMTWRIANYKFAADVWTETVDSGATGTRTAVMEDSEDWASIMLSFSPATEDSVIDVVYYKRTTSLID